MGDLLNRNINTDDEVFLTSDEVSAICSSSVKTSTPKTVEQSRAETVQSLIVSCTQIAESVRKRLAKSHIHVQFADATIERLVQLTCKIVEKNWIPDLLQFAAHAGRTNPNIEDADLIFRRSESVNKRIDSLVDSFRDESDLNVSSSVIDCPRNQSTNLFTHSVDENSEVGVQELDQQSPSAENVFEAQPQIQSIELTSTTTITRPPTIRRPLQKVSALNRLPVPQQRLVPQPSISRRSDTAPLESDVNATKTPEWWGPVKHSTPAERRAALQRAAQQKTQVIAVKRTLPVRPEPINLPPKRPNLVPQPSNISHPKPTSRLPQQKR
ncbi:hypothetical protein M3Y98_01196400 [Aphelenchoides besseyi]|nr:hypothetical protein M3Y98_01196400 [Aphelenchoides besseyi]KAI6193160.1 hypothetical protein M3Y96_00989000 [Aphelenchoides besseyi]